MDTFNISKKTTLEKFDKSSKGAWDQKIIPLCNTLNRLPDFFTTSSCAGRITLVKDPDPGKKQKNIWLFTTHEPIKGLPEDNFPAWLKCEPFIVHVCCRTIKHAKILLDLARSLGFKRSGVISLKKIIVEIIGTEKIENFLTDELPKEYLEQLTFLASQKLRSNWQNIHVLEKEIIDRLQ